MKVSECPSFIVRKLTEFAELAEEIDREREQLRERLEVVTKVVRGRADPPDVVNLSTPPFDYKKYEDEFHALTQKLATTAGKGAPWRTYKHCRQWIEKLPPGTTFEEVVTRVLDGTDLADMRRRIARAQAAADKIKRLPSPSEDIEDRLRAYVAGLNAVSITGIQEGERLDINWGRGPMTNQPIIDPTPLQLEALLRPDELVAALLAKVGKMALGSCPTAERPARIP